MNTHELLVEFVRKGGVITLSGSDLESNPICFSARFKGNEWAGNATDLYAVLSEILEPPQDYEDDMWHSAFDR